MASRATVLLFYILLFRNGSKQTIAACSNLTLLSTQLDTLLAEYDREVVPGDTVVVEVSMDLRHASIDERTSTVHLLADLHMTWTDTRINWNSTEWNCDSATVFAERLWLPDLMLLNSATFASSDSPLRAQVSSKGKIAWIDRIYVNAPIAMQLEDWPYDTQIVTFRFGSRAHSTDELDLYVTDFKYLSVWGSGGWEAQAVTATTSEWSRAGEEVREVAWELRLQRRAATHSLATGAVFAACVLLLIASGILPPAARAPLCACAAFTSALWLISALIRLPDAATTPLVVSLMATVCASAGTWCACAALVQRLARVREPPPHAVRSLLAGASAWCRLTPDESIGDGEVSAWAAAAQLLDYVLLAILALTLFVLICLYP